MKDVTDLELLIFELGIYAESRASDEVIEDKEWLDEFCKRYNISSNEIQNLFKKLNKKYVEVVCK